MSIIDFEGRTDAPPGDRKSWEPTRGRAHLRDLSWPGRTRRNRWPGSVRRYLVGSDIVALSGFALATGQGWVGLLVVVTSAFVVLGALDTHRSRLTLSALDDLPRLALASLVGTVASVTWLLLAGAEPTASQLLGGALGLTTTLVATRALAYAGVREARRRGLVEHRALVLGTGDTGRQIARTALNHPELGLRPVGFLDAERVTGVQDLPVPLLGSYDQLAHFIRREGVSEVIVTFLDDDPAGSVTSGRDAGLVEVVRDCDRMDCEIFCVPRFHELRRRGHDMDELWGIPLVRAHRATWRSGTWRLKRLLDIAVAGAALLVLAPLMMALALAVRLEVGPQILFRQVRVGLDGQPFTLLKFRSLMLPADPGDGAAPPPVWSINGDGRLGPVGRFIRATSLDELPQLVNILRGQMSLVGPRPERPEFVAEFSSAIPSYSARHRAPAGLTGWAQVNGLRGDTSIAERARLDNYYIQNWSLWFDVKILARTASSVLLRKGS